MTPQPAPAQTPQSRGWTPARRAAQAEAIRRWRPWAKSTGPKTAAGKARVAQNAAKGSARARRPDPDEIMKHALKNQSRYLTEINRFLAAREKSGQNKLLKRQRQTLVKRGLQVQKHLLAALAYKTLDLRTVILGEPKVSEGSPCIPFPTEIFRSAQDGTAPRTSLRGGTADEAIHPPHFPRPTQDGLPRRHAPRNDNEAI